MSNRLLTAAFALALTVQAALASGEIVIDRTRLIYPGAARAVTVNLHNAADGPRLVQVWIDEGDPQALPELSDVPFTVTPPILRMEAGNSQALRVAYHPVPGPAVKPAQESVYWLNVRGIRPIVETSNQLQFAFRTRIKLFLRPEALPGRAQESVQALEWRLGDTSPALHVRNPGAFHVTLSSVVLTSEGVEYRSDDPPMLLPHAAAYIAINGWVAPSRGPVTLRFTTLDDQGATQEHALSLIHPTDGPVSFTPDHAPENSAI